MARWDAKFSSLVCQLIPRFVIQCKIGSDSFGIVPNPGYSAPMHSSKEHCSEKSPPFDFPITRPNFAQGSISHGDCFLV